VVEIVVRLEVRLEGHQNPCSLYQF
jgi:hypothetical protein